MLTVKPMVLYGSPRLGNPLSFSLGTLVSLLRTPKLRLLCSRAILLACAVAVNVPVNPAPLLTLALAVITGANAEVNPILARAVFIVLVV